MIRLLAFVLPLALLLPRAAEAAAPIAFTGGADDEIVVRIGQTTGKYFRLKTDDDHLKLRAEGPVILTLRFRALTSENASGTLRILRDDGPYSDNPYKLGPDTNATADESAKVEKNAVSTEKILNLRVGEGTHRYSISALKGPAVAVRFFKVAASDPKFDAQPEKNTWTGSSPAPEGAPTATVEKVEPKPAKVEKNEAQPPPPVAKAPPEPAKPPPAPKPEPAKPPPAPKPEAPKPPLPAPKPVTEAPKPPAPRPEAKPAAPVVAPPAKPASPVDAGNPFDDLPPIE